MGIGNDTLERVDLLVGGCCEQARPVVPEPERNGDEPHQRAVACAQGIGRTRDRVTRP